MIRQRLLLGFLLATGLLAQDFSRLPDWAAAQARDAAAQAPPADADAWVLLDRTECAYRGDGEIRKRTYRLVRILTERGLEEGRYVIHGLGGAASKVKKLKGWNLRPDGELLKLDKDYTVTVSGASAQSLSADTATFGTLDRVAKGSFVAFEAEEVVTSPLGPVDGSFIMETQPIRRWELELVKNVGWFKSTSSDAVGVRLEARHFQPWFPAPDPKATALVLTNLPALPRHEACHPDPHNFQPRVWLTFTDPSLKDAPDVTSWDSLARWTCRKYEAQAKPVKPVDLAGRTGLEALRLIHDWMRRELALKQFYLTPERGWTPEASEEVLRIRFGDCKDLATFFMGSAKAAGLDVYPVLARVMEGAAESDEPVGQSPFNHAIAAIRLDQPSGLPAEVVTPHGRFVLVDLTTRFTPLGRLSAAHRGRRVLICTPQGGAWAQIPDEAILQPKVAIHVQADQTASAGLKGTLVVDTSGGALGLRELALSGGPKAVKEVLVQLLRLPLGSRCELAPLPDPKDTQEAYHVKASFELVEALTPNGSEWLLPRTGLPGNPSAIQRLGEPRRYPVLVEDGPVWDYDGVFHLTAPVRPVTPSAKLETPFRSVTWSAAAQDKTWTLHFHQDTREVAYPYERREEGVKDQRADWKAFRLFMENALSVGL